MLLKVLLSTFSFLLFPLLHDYHVGICEIEHNSSTQNIEITIQLFADDLEKAMLETGFPKPFFGSQMEHSNADAFLQLYLREQFWLTINENPVFYDFIGREMENEAIFCYLEVPNVKEVSINRLFINNQLLMDAFDDQVHHLNFKMGSKEISQIFNSNNYSVRWEMDQQNPTTIQTEKTNSKTKKEKKSKAKSKKKKHHKHSH